MKKASINFILGFTIGTIMFGSTAAYAVSMLATPATNKILVDGEEIRAEAYIIDGRNYVQLRDMAAAVNFSVVWDEANNRVLVDTRHGYDPNETLPVAASTPIQSEAPTMSIDEMRAEIIRLTNAERAKAGVPELEVLPALMDCAQAKAQDFIENHYYAHTSPVYGTAQEMIRSFVPNVGGGGENIAFGQYTPQETVEAWMDSSGHLANMLGAKYTHIGAGISQGANGRCFWVAQFITR